VCAVRGDELEAEAADDVARGDYFAMTQIDLFHLSSLSDG
jgi:hypothetical protein